MCLKTPDRDLIQCIVVAIISLEITTKGWKTEVNLFSSHIFCQAQFSNFIC